MSALDELERFLAKYDSPEGATWDEGKDFQAQLENAAPALLRLALPGRFSFAPSVIECLVVRSSWALTSRCSASGR